jgi:hypothetical protein
MANYGARIQTAAMYDITDQNKRNNENQFRLLTLKHEFLEMSVKLKAAFADETHLAEGQWLE